MINDKSMLMVDNTADKLNNLEVRTPEEKTFIEQAGPKLKLLEEIRLIKLRVYKFRKSLAIPAALLITPFLGYIDWLLLLWQRGDDKAAGLSAAFLGLLYWWVTQPKRQYAAEYKKSILPGLAKLFGHNFQYHMDGKIRMAELEPSKIVPYHNIYNAEDYFRGDYKGVGMEFVEMELKKRTGSGKNRRTVTVFKGLAVLLDMKHKKFLGHTIMDRNSSKLGQWFKEKSHGLDRANMVDPEFEKVFDVYTNDQVEARYIIDPLMIERLKGLYLEYHGEKMAVSFYDSKMLIMIASQHNHFEPASLYTPATDPQSILSMKREIGEILSLVDKLSLYDSRLVRAA